MMADPQPDVAFHREERNGEATLVVAGEVDIASVSFFSEQLRALIDAAHSPAVLDLGELSFLDSSGVAALLAAHTAAQERGVDLILLSPTDMVRRVLDVTGVAPFLRIHPAAVPSNDDGPTVG
jgi:anti-anti-sigma factor